MRSRRWWILILLALFLFTNGYVFPTVASRIAEYAGVPSFRPLDLTPAFAPDQAYSSIASLGDGGRRLYAMVELTIDVVYPIVYAFLFFLLARAMLERSQPAPRWLARATLLPFLPAALDLIENAFILALMIEFPDRNDGLALVASVVTTTKLISLIATLLLLVFLSARWAVVRRRAPASA